MGKEREKSIPKFDYLTQGETLDPKLLVNYAQQEIYYDRPLGT